MGKELEYAGARSALLHQGVAQRLVAEFKFGGQPVLGRSWPTWPAPSSWPMPASLPSPGGARLSPGCRRIARPSASGATTRRNCWRAGLPVRRGPTAPGPRRQEPGHPASEGSGQGGPAEQPAGGFHLAARGRPQWWRRRGATVSILVDDVYTTGATAAEVVSRPRRGYGSTGVRVHLLEGDVGQRRKGTTEGGYMVSFIVLPPTWRDGWRWAEDVMTSQGV